MEYKDIRIKSDENLESQVQTLKEYYWVKSKSGAIKKAIRDCAMIARHTAMEIKIMTKDNKLLLSKDETSDSIVKDMSLKVDYETGKVIIKLLNDYKSDSNLDVTDKWEILAY